MTSNNYRYFRNFNPCPRNQKTFKIANKNGPISRDFGFVSRFPAYTQKKGNEGAGQASQR
jgi:hypothetical protein